MSRRTKIALGAAAVLLGLVVAVFGGWWFLIRTDAPDPVSLEGAVAAATSTTAAAVTEAPTGETEPAAATTFAAATTTAAAATTPAPASTAAAPDTTAPAPAAAGLDGRWTVDGADSFVGYRVGEELAGIGAATAVGRTSDVTGTLELAGATVTRVAIDADLATLQSDDNRRDRALRTRGLETDTFPTAAFATTAPIELGAVPEPGVPIEVVAQGTLTLHGVTRDVEVPLQAQIAGEFIAVVGSIPVVLADYDIEPPTGLAVLSIEDNGVVEFQLLFARA